MLLIWSVLQDFYYELNLSISILAIRHNENNFQF